MPRSRIAKNPKTAKERGKKGAHVRKSKYAKGNKKRRRRARRNRRSSR